MRVILFMKNPMRRLTIASSVLSGEIASTGRNHALCDDRFNQFIAGKINSSWE